MSYRFTTTESALNHAGHNWEEWHAYLSAEVPEGTSLDGTGICCHDCLLVVVDAA